jgi:hypothetical protein
LASDNPSSFCCSIMKAKKELYFLLPNFSD